MSSASSEDENNSENSENNNDEMGATESRGEASPNHVGNEWFDTNLPTTHQYLGRLNSLSGYTLFDDGEVITLMAIQTNTMVFPGFTLPLVMPSYEEQYIIQNRIGEKNVFVLVCADDAGAKLYGVTMEIYESFMVNNTLHLKAMGRQRCMLAPGTDTRHMGGRFQQVTVKILGEAEMASPIACTQLLSLKLRKPCLTNTYSDIMGSYKYRRYHLSQFSNAPWVYDRNEVCFYVKLILESLKSFYKRESIPTDAMSLSFWIMQNFQLTHEERLALMKLNTTLERLRLELRFLKLSRLFCCGFCKSRISTQASIIAMSKDGVQSNYCNPEGHVFETVTVVHVDNCRMYGRPSKKFSWFPGYEWTIVTCGSCRSHLGWKFTSKSLLPSIFYGLSTGNLYIKIDNDCISAI